MTRVCHKELTETTVPRHQVLRLARGDSSVGSLREVIFHEGEKRHDSRQGSCLTQILTSIGRSCFADTIEAFLSSTVGRSYVHCGWRSLSPRARR